MFCLSIFSLTKGVRDIIFISFSLEMILKISPENFKFLKSYFVSVWALGYAEAKTMNRPWLKRGPLNFHKMAAEVDLAKFDDVFLGILQHLGRIEPFLEAMFFFLARRTDFFKLMHNREDKMGFPPGVAKQIVIRVKRISLINLDC